MTNPPPPPTPPTLSRAPVLRRRWWRIGCIVYFLVLATATHWPAVVIEGPIDRPDLLIHVAAFAVLGLLVAMTGWTGRPGTVRNAALAGIIAGAYAIVDEVTQAIPALRRVADASDAAANLVGVILGAAASLLAGRRTPGRSSQQQP